MDKTYVNPEAEEFYQRGLAALRKKNYDYALDLFRDALAREPEYAACRHNLWLAAREKRKSMPFSLFGALKRMFSGLAARIFLYLCLLFNKPDKAAAVQENLILRGCAGAAAFLFLAKLYTFINQPARAQTACEEVLFIDKHNPAALLKLARIYFEQKNYAKAKTAAQILLARQPRNMEAENILKDIAALGVIEKTFTP